MNIKSLKILLFTLFIGSLAIYFIVDNTDIKIENTSINRKVVSTNIVKIDNVIKPNEPRVEDELQPIVDLIQPLSKKILRDEWESEYGCFKQNAKSDLYENACKHTYLTASSYEEALWMQRQGYPSSSNLALLDDSENLKLLERLANENKYTTAMALLTIKNMEEENYHDASLMALKLVSYSSKNNTFPHRIMGEALLAENNLPYGLLELKIASLLGDYESKYLFNRYTHKYPDIAIDATDHANLYMGRVFNVPYGQYPKDDRPINDNGG